MDTKISIITDRQNELNEIKKVHLLKQIISFICFQQKDQKKHSFDLFCKS